MTQPDSFCFISTFNCSHELIGMLLSLSIHHNNSKDLDLFLWEEVNYSIHFVLKLCKLHSQPSLNIQKQQSLRLTILTSFNSYINQVYN